MPTGFLFAMLDWRKRIMAEEQLGQATIAMLPHMQKDDRQRWANGLVRDAQGGQKAMPSQMLRGPQENPPLTFAGLAVIVEQAE